MTTDSWKEFAKERPSKCQDVLLLFSDGGMVHERHYQDRDRVGVTHWQLWADPRHPDPFEEWHQAWTTMDNPVLKETRRSAWDAGVKWAREHPEAK